MKRLAQRLKRPIRIAHYPPYHSKYNPIERRLFCHVHRALQGVILHSLEVARDFVAQTTTSMGLRVFAETTEKVYRTKRKASEEFIQQQPIERDEVLPELNYILNP